MAIIVLAVAVAIVLSLSGINCGFRATCSWPRSYYKPGKIKRYDDWPGTSFTLNNSEEYHEYELASAPALRDIQIVYSSTVTRLAINDCPLADVPGTIGTNLPSLWTLELTSCQFRNISVNSFRNITHLNNLNLSHNLINTIVPPTNIGDSLPIQRLELVGNRLSRLDMRHLESLSLYFLYLDANQLEVLEPHECSLPQLQELTLDSNRLEVLNMTLWQMPNLRRLSCVNNRLTSLPAGWRLLPKFHCLDMSHNRLSTFSMDQLSLTELKLLNLTANRLTSVNTTVAKLHVPLEQLLVARNELTVLNISHWSMPRLWDLNVSDNRLTELGDVFVRFRKSSEVFDLRGNNWSCEWLSSIHPADLSVHRYGYLLTNDTATCPTNRTLTVWTWSHNPESQSYAICCHG
uniref:Leucine rich immune protein (Coil-less) n=1 Tax=Anopheles albimanus TaxID=7167 RepID=A0A182FF34_ANOAL